jgi:hypothetical protein
MLSGTLPARNREQVITHIRDFGRYWDRGSASRLKATIALKRLIERTLKQLC